MAVGRGKEIERIEVDDQTTNRAMEPMRERINELGRELDGVRDIAEGIDGVIKFDTVSAPAGTTLPNEDIELPDATLVKLSHGLGKRLRGWLVTDLRGSTTAGIISRVLSSGGVDADDKRDLWLRADDFGATVTVRVVVY